MEGCKLIDASFGTKSREATVSGAYQYDVGQRLRLTGLPSEEELKAQDEMLAEDSVIAVAVQFAFKGDDRTEERSAFWSDEEQAWTVEIPDVYLQRSADVLMYVVVSHGATDKASRAKTFYEAVFRPISRPAPGTSVSPAVKDDWAALRQEVTAAIRDADNAVTGENGANSAASKARDAAAAANEAARKAAADVNTYLSFLGRTDVTAERIAPYAEPTIKVEKKTDDAGAEYTLVTFGIPQSVVTVNGIEAESNGDIKMDYKDVGAMPATHQTVFEFKATVPTTGWEVSGNIAYNYIPVAGLVNSDAPMIDVVTSGIIPVGRDTVEPVMEAWSKIYRIDVDDNQLKLFCFADDLPEVSFSIKILCVR